MKEQSQTLNYGHVINRVRFIRAQILYLKRVSLKNDIKHIVLGRIMRTEIERIQFYLIFYSISRKHLYVCTF